MGLKKEDYINVRLEKEIYNKLRELKELYETKSLSKTIKFLLEMYNI